MDCYKEQPEKTLDDDIVLPGFRFHPTDEELVSFYLKMKIQHKSLPIELIHQVDIYKYDPWELPKLAASGEKEWYFYCPRDRKYRNSSRPNRVTGAGFWKATGTDRPIYASDHGTKCIGLKKSLVFYQGRAAKGIKTDWMMHEFRLPSVSDPKSPAKKFSDKNIPASESWAICRIFKKNTSMAQRALPQSWAGQLHEVHTPNMFGQVAELAQFNPGIFSSATPIEFISSNDMPNYNPTDQQISPRPTFPFRANTPVNFMLSSPAASMFPNMPLPLYNNEFSKGLEMEDFVASEDHQFNDFTISLSQDVQENTAGYEGVSIRKNADYTRTGTIRGMEFPFSLSPTNTLQVCEEPGLPWDSSPSTGDVSITYSADKS